MKLLDADALHDLLIIGMEGLHVGIHPAVHFLEQFLHTTHLLYLRDSHKNPDRINVSIILHIYPALQLFIQGLQTVSVLSFMVRFINEDAQVPEVMLDGLECILIGHAYRVHVDAARHDEQGIGLALLHLRHPGGSRRRDRLVSRRRRDARR